MVCNTLPLLTLIIIKTKRTVTFLVGLTSFFNESSALFLKIFIPNEGKARKRFFTQLPRDIGTTQPFQLTSACMQINSLSQTISTSELHNTTMMVDIKFNPSCVSSTLTNYLYRTSIFLLVKKTQITVQLKQVSAHNLQKRYILPKSNLH